MVLLLFHPVKYSLTNYQMEHQYFLKAGKIKCGDGLTNLTSKKKTK